MTDLSPHTQQSLRERLRNEAPDVYEVFEGYAAGRAGLAAADSLQPRAQDAILAALDSIKAGWVAAVEDHVAVVLAVIFSTGRARPPRASDKPLEALPMPSLPAHVHNPVYQALYSLGATDEGFKNLRDSQLGDRHTEILNTFRPGLDFAELILEEAIYLMESGDGRHLETVRRIYRILESAADINQVRLSYLQARLHIAVSEWSVIHFDKETAVTALATSRKWFEELTEESQPEPMDPTHEENERPADQEAAS